MLTILESQFRPKMINHLATSLGGRARCTCLILTLLSLAGCSGSAPSAAPAAGEAKKSSAEPAVRVAAASDLQFALRKVNCQI